MVTRKSAASSLFAIAIALMASNECFAKTHAAKPAPDLNPLKTGTFQVFKSNCLRIVAIKYSCGDKTDLHDAANNRYQANPATLVCDEKTLKQEGDNGRMVWGMDCTDAGHKGRIDECPWSQHPAPNPAFTLTKDLVNSLMECGVDQKLVIP